MLNRQKYDFNVIIPKDEPYIYIELYQRPNINRIVKKIFKVVVIFYIISIFFYLKK